MAFRITITDEAETQLKALSARERGTIEGAILTRLRDQPTTPTKAIKRLREEFHEHQMDPLEPPGGGPAGDPD